MALTTHPAEGYQPRISRLERLLVSIARRWRLVVVGIAALYIGLPWLAPVFMQLGWTSAARLIYTLYATQCHQLPQRSFFLFGSKLTYSLPEIQSAWVVTDDARILRQFVGTPEMGWKVAWSDRMVALYTSGFFAALICWRLRRRLPRLSPRMFILLGLPMVLDGATHAISDYVGLAGSFRATNDWLALITNNALPPTFYAGDALGSFNSWMRLITGILFGVSSAWLVSSQIGRRFNPPVSR